MSNEPSKGQAATKTSHHRRSPGVSDDVAGEVRSRREPKRSVAEPVAELAASAAELASAATRPSSKPAASSSPTDAAARDGVRDHAASEDGAHEDGAHEDGAHEDGAHEEAARNEAAPEESAHKDVAHKEPAHKEVAHKEPAHKEDVHKEPAHKEDVHKEPAHKEVAHKEPAHKEPAHKEVAHKGTAPGATKDGAPSSARPARAAAGGRSHAESSPATVQDAVRAEEASGEDTAVVLVPETESASEPAPRPPAARQAAPARNPVPLTAAAAATYTDDPEFLAEQRKALLAERETYLEQASSLRAEAELLVAEMEPGDVQFDEESGEGGTVTVDRERDLALSAQALAAVEEIDAALAKMDRGSYGVCEGCGELIVKPRLEALPYARLCVACKSGGLSRR